MKYMNSASEFKQPLPPETTNWYFVLITFGHVSCYWLASNGLGKKSDMMEYLPFITSPCSSLCSWKTKQNFPWKQQWYAICGIASWVKISTFPSNLLQIEQELSCEISICMGFLLITHSYYSSCTTFTSDSKASLYSWDMLFGECKELEWYY